MRLCIVTFVLIFSISQVGAAQTRGPHLIEAPGPDGPLSGTMLASTDPEAPIILIIPGSGPTDRDGNSPLGVRPSTYKLIAEGLASRGIATVRIDKRGLFGSSRAISNANTVTIEDYAADIHTWISIILKESGSSCVWVLGHSEGGLVALMAAKSAEKICGLILVATAGRPLGYVLREQIGSNTAVAPFREEADAIIARLEAGERVNRDGIHPELQPLFRPEVQDFLISTFAVDPAKLIESYKGPVLIMQGLRDIQLGQADAARLLNSHPGAELVLLPEANHVLKAVATDDRAANIAAYLDPDRPLAPGVIEALVTFVRRSGKNR